MQLNTTQPSFAIQKLILTIMRLKLVAFSFFITLFIAGCSKSSTDSVTTIPSDLIGTWTFATYDLNVAFFPIQGQTIPPINQTGQTIKSTTPLTLTFKADGTCSGNGFVSPNLVSTSTTVTPTKITGTYSVNQDTLKVTGTDGTTSSTSTVKFLVSPTKLQAIYDKNLALLTIKQNTSAADYATYKSVFDLYSSYQTTNNYTK